LKLTEDNIRSAISHAAIFSMPMYTRNVIHRQDVAKDTRHLLPQSLKRCAKVTYKSTTCSAEGVLAPERTMAINMAITLTFETSQIPVIHKLNSD